MAKKKRGIKLVYSLGIDLIGMTSYIFPGIGEIFDLVWSPISAILVYKLYGNVFFTIVDFVEELSPVLDFIPTATIMWFYENFKGNQDEN
ncbi:MAG: hypothetical protein AABW82_02000 [Nanoarchaeota archaeon]